MLGKFARGSERAPLVVVVVVCRRSSSSIVVVERRRRASSCASGSNLENPPTVSNPRRLASPPIAITSS